MHHYVYRIRDLRTDGFYIGMRSSELAPDQDLGKVYFSSSSNRDFIRDQRENPDQFQYEVINTFADRDEARAHETTLLNEHKDNPKCYNGDFHVLPPPHPVGYTTRKIIQYLGQLIKVARKERKMSESDLAERVGVVRATIQKVEKGDPSVAIGTVIEATVVLGIPLLGGDKEHITNLTTMLNYMNNLLPNSIRGKVIEVDDDF